METKSIPRENSRAKIVETALELFARNGYDRTPISMIAREAGVAQGLMYRYFSSKEALLSDIIKQSIVDLQTSFDVNTSASPIEKLEEYLTNVVNTMKKNRHFWSLFYALRSQSFLQELLANELVEFQKNIIKTLEAFFDPRDPEIQHNEALLLFSIVDGVCTSYVFASEAMPYPIEEIKECILNKYR
jgi:AcrR family transcriptional regulator